jgi:hypothetical protein
LFVFLAGTPSSAIEKIAMRFLDYLCAVRVKMISEAKRRC